MLSTVFQYLNLLRLLVLAIKRDQHAIISDIILISFFLFFRADESIDLACSVGVCLLRMRG